jgi:hypothetical protein
VSGWWLVASGKEEKHETAKEEMTTIYQLVADGPRTCELGYGVLRSRTVYRTPDAAKQEIPQFTARCCGGEVGDLEPDTIKVKLSELQLVD